MALNGFQCDIELEAPAVPDSVEATGAMHWVCSSLFLEDPGQSRQKRSPAVDKEKQISKRSIV